MTLLRFAARTMLASYFIASGSRPCATRVPWSRSPSRWSTGSCPLVKQYAPEQVAGYIPEDAESRWSGSTARCSWSAASRWRPARAVASARCCWPAR